VIGYYRALGEFVDLFADVEGVLFLYLYTFEQRTGKKPKNDYLTGKAPYKFESASLQRGVRNEPSPEVMLVSPIFRDLPILLGRVRTPVRHPDGSTPRA
jgi:hypothetical protein